MADTSNQRIALMSIKPEYAERLLSGSKQVEFRRTGPKEAVRWILVYATQPIGALVGVLEVAAANRASPQKLWHDFGSVGGIEEAEFFSYFAGAISGEALVVSRAVRFNQPVRLEAAGLPVRPPQSFRYVDASILSTLGVVVEEPPPKSAGRGARGAPAMPQ